MKKQYIGFAAISGLILAGTLSLAMPLSAQDPASGDGAESASKENVEKYEEKLYFMEYSRAAGGRVEIDRPSFYFKDTLVFTLKVPITSFSKGCTYRYSFEGSEKTGVSKYDKYHSLENTIPFVDFNDKFVDIPVVLPLKSLVFTAEDGVMKTFDHVPARQMAGITMRLRNCKEDGSTLTTTTGNLGVWEIKSAKKMRDQNIQEGGSDAVAAVANALRMFCRDLDAGAYKEMAEHYKGKTGITAAQILKDGGLSEQSEFETIEKSLTLDTIKTHLKDENVLIVNVNGKEDGAPVHTITIDSVSDEKLQYTDPSDGTFKYCLADLKDGRIRLEDAEADDYRTFTITVVKNVDHWSLDHLAGRNSLKNHVGKYLLVKDVYGSSRKNTVGKPSFYIADTLSLSMRIPMKDLEYGYKYSYKFVYYDNGYSPMHEYSTPEKEIVIKDYDDPYFVLDINAPLNSFQYTDKDGSTTNERPELKKMTPIKVMLTARQADGSVYRRLDLSNLRTWRIAEEKDSLQAE